MAWPEADEVMLGFAVRARTGRRSVASDGGPPWFEGATQALEAVGALDASEAAGWRARVQREALEDEPRDRAVASTATRRRARRMLDALLVPTRAGRMRKANVEPFETLLAACEVARVFSAPEIEGWLERLASARELPGPGQERAERPSATELLAVIPGPPAADEGLRVRWIELFADALVVHWLVTVDLDPDGGSEARMEAMGRANPDLAMVDDAGTEYEVAGGVGGGREGTARGGLAGHTVFAPGAARAARRLDLLEGRGGPVHMSIALPR